MSEENPYAPPEANIEIPAMDETELASRWARLGGSILDGLALGVVFWGAIFVFGFFDQLVAGTVSTATDFAFLVGSLVLFLVLNGYLLATRGQTIGKVAVGTRIVSYETERLVPLWKLMALRYIPFFALGYIPILGQVLGLINPLFIFKEDRRCLHDHVAGTMVIKANAYVAD